MTKKIDANADINNPPFPSKGNIVEWDGSSWVEKPIPKPIPQKPSDVDGFYWEFNRTTWVWDKIAKPKPYVPSELEKAENYLENTAWLFIDGIIDILPNATEIKAARALAIDVLKKHKAEIQVASNF